METPKPKIFISYSSMDRPFLDDLLVHLKPDQRAGRLSIWEDHQISVGGNPDKTIEDAIDSAGLALLLISPHFIASDYVYEKEIPRLLHRAERSEIVIAPLFVRSSRVEETPFPFTDSDGGEQGVVLTTFQGFRAIGNTPENPLAAVKEASRAAYDTILAAVARELAKPPAKKDDGGGDIDAGTVKARPTDPGRPVLTVVFDDHEGRMRVTLQTKTGSLPFDRDLDLVLRSTKINHGGQTRRGFPAYRVAQSSYANLAAVEDAGDNLGLLLLGKEEHHAALLKLIAGASQAVGTNLLSVNPRVRISDRTAGQQLAQLPWRWATLNGDRLEEDFGWTFEIALERAGRAVPVTLPHVPKTLVMSEYESFVDDVKKELSTLSPQAVDDKHFCHTTDLNGACDHLPHFVPDLVVGLVDAALESGVWWMGRGAKRWPLSKFTAMVAQHPPLLIDWCVRVSAGNPVPSPTLFAPARCCLVHPAGAQGRGDLRWFHRVLGGADPVLTLAKEQTDPESQSPAAWKYPVLGTAYHTWSAAALAKSRLFGLKFDRRTPRARAYEVARALWRDATQKVHVLCAYGANHHLVDHFSEQAQQYIIETESSMPLIIAQAAGACGKTTKQDIESAVLGKLRPSNRIYWGLKETFAHVVTEGSFSRDVRLLWLDVGTLTREWTWSDQQERIEAIVAWAAAVGVDAVIPERARIVLYFGLETDSAYHNAVRGWFENELDQRVRGEAGGAAGLTLLPALTDVSAKDLRDYLAETDDLVVNRSDQESIVQSILHQTRGQYEQTLAELKKVRDQGAAEYLKHHPPPKDNRKSTDG
ncbi:MAG: toll/interleukin-1 receptor domain-containing protein [Myxococcales bacterium]|nr:toll/interleukin-1 receptor domain-containing protein [Myxococcales bacterium]